jgi:serine phosphatase RsbU (regulator of sigma subunit)
MLDGEAFEATEQSAPFNPGDILYIYSDGATESRNPQGQMLNVAGLQELLSRRPTTTAAVDSIKAHRSAPPQDDTLMVRLDHV